MAETDASAAIQKGRDQHEVKDAQQETSPKGGPRRRQCCLLVLIGLPGAGKSTFVGTFRDFLKAEEEEGKDSSCRTSLVHVCFDRLVPPAEQARLAALKAGEVVASGGGEVATSEWRQVRDNVVKAVELLVSADEEVNDAAEPPEQAREFARLLEQQLPEDDDGDERKLLVVVDDNNYYRSMRYDYYQLARRHRLGYCQLHLDLPLHLARRVNASRPAAERVPAAVLERMQDKMEAPRLLSGGSSWELFSFGAQVFGAGPHAGSDLPARADLPLPVCTNLVRLAFDNPVLPAAELGEDARAADRAACGASLVHQSDKVLRKALGEEVRRCRGGDASPSASLGALKKKLVQARSDVLQDLRAGFSRLPADLVKKWEEAGGQADEVAHAELAAAVRALYKEKLREYEYPELAELRIE